MVGRDGEVILSASLDGAILVGGSCVTTITDDIEVCG